MEEKKWRCTVCGYIHTGENPPNQCPVCGVGPEQFELISGEKPDTELAPQEERSIKSALYKISYGLFIVSSLNGEKINGQACNTLFQISSKPYTVAISINKDNLTNEYIKESGVFSACILGQNAHNVVRRFGYRSGREKDKFAGIDYHRELTGAPILKDCLAYLECQVIKDKTLDVFTHNIFVGEVIGGKLLIEEEPMTYEYYRKTK